MMDSVSPSPAGQAAPSASPPSAGPKTEASPTPAERALESLSRPEPDPEKQFDTLDHGVPQDQPPAAPYLTDAHDAIRNPQPPLPGPGVPEATSVSNIWKRSFRDKVKPPRPEAVASTKEQKPDASGTNTNVSGHGQERGGADDANKAEAAKPKARSPEAPSLVDLSNLPIPLLPSIDIVAIHDLGQLLTTAWAYTPGKDLAKRQGDASAQAHALQNPAPPEPANSSRPVPHVVPATGRAEPKAGDRDVRRRSTGVRPLDDSAQGRNAVAPNQAALSSTAGVDVLRAADKAPTTLPGEPGVGSTNKGKGRADLTPGDIGTWEDGGRTANDPTPQEQEPPSAAGGTDETRPDDHDRTPTRISRQSERPSSNKGSKPPSDKDKGTKPGNWLTDRTMLAGDLVQARVLAFSYRPLEPTQPRPPNDSSPKAPGYDTYLKETAEALLSRLQAERTDHLSKIPLVFIASGFGCLIAQKLIGLVAESDAGSAILDMIAAIVFFDAPDTNATKGRRTEAAKASMPVLLPSPASSSRTIRVKDILQTKLTSAGKLWERFHATVQQRELSTVWFYTPAQPSNRAAHAPSPRAAAIDFVSLDPVPSIPPTSIASNRSTSRFRGPWDPNYCRLVEQIKRCLVLKASAHKGLEEHLTQFIAWGYNLDVKDHRRRCPLHRAAQCVNDAALTRLVNAKRELAAEQDEDGLTPLHAVVIKAVSVGPKEEDRAPFRIMVEKLLLALTETRREDDTKDDSGRTPWDYAAEENHRWIRELRDVGFALDGARKAPPETLESLVRRPEEIEAKACSRADATLAQFYIATDNSRDYLDPQRPDVYTVIYHPDYGVDKLFQRNLRHDQALRATCRWIHLPANNEQWTHDLFVQRLRRIDKSTSDRRHRGTAPFDRHIAPGAFRCEQIFEPRDDERAPNSSLPASPIPSPSLSVRSADIMPGTVAKTGIALFMPVFGFETHGNRQKLTSAMRNPWGTGEDETSRLIRAYFNNDRFPLHCRRTLDQFTYHMLSDTESRDNTQVMYKWTKRQQFEKLCIEYPRDDMERPSLTRQRRDKVRNTCPLLMVDQLWLWYLEDEETVITCLPNTWEPTEDYNLVRYMMRHKLRDNDDRRLIEGPLDFVNCIVQCSVEFLHRPGPLGVRLFECFQSNISYISERQGRQFGKFTSIVERLNKDGIDQPTRSELTNALFRLTTETHLLAEIFDIQDELKTIHEVLLKQKEVLREFLQLLPSAPRKGRTHADTVAAPESPGPQAEKDSFESVLRNVGREPRARRTVHFDVAKDDERRWHQMSKAKRQAEENLDLVSSNIATIKQMLEHAGKVQVEINALLSHRQKQANAWEARFAREGSEHTQRQSNITLVFTMVTVFFLPLSFMSSIFAIQIDAYPHNTESGEVNWPLGEAMALLFGISIAVILLIALIGFNINRISNFYAKHLGPSSAAPSPESRHHDDSDDSDSDDSDRTGSSRSARSAKSVRSDDKASESPFGYVESYLSGRYAPLFGRWHFHSYIPVVRRLWWYRWYFPINYQNPREASRPVSPASSGWGDDDHDNEDEGEGGSELELDWDYPLHRARVVAGQFVRDYILRPLARLVLPKGLLLRMSGPKEKADSDVVVVVEDAEPELLVSHRSHPAHGDPGEERYISPGPGTRRAATSGSVIVDREDNNPGTMLTDAILRRRAPQRTRARSSMSRAAGFLFPWRWREAAGGSRTRHDRDHHPATSTASSSEGSGSWSAGTSSAPDADDSSGSGRGDGDVGGDEAGEGRKGSGGLGTVLSFLGRRKARRGDVEVGRGLSS